MTIEIRPVTLGEFPEYMRRALAANYGWMGRPEEEEIERYQSTFEPDRSIAAFDDGCIVATVSVLSLELTLPGHVRVSAAGISWVTVQPTHRRQGLLRRLMNEQFENIRGYGDSIAVLNASESSIYERFGYGVATSRVDYEIERVHAQLKARPTLRGQLRMIDEEEAIEMLPSLYDEVRAGQPGAVSRSPGLWKAEVLRPTSAGKRYFVVHESETRRIDGAAHYNITRQSQQGLSTSVLLLGELFALTPAARAAIWRFCLSMDYIHTIRASSRPLDEPLRWMLVDSRRLRVIALSDDLWVRLLDIPTALSARRYTGRGRITFRVRDSFLPENSGTYLLECESGGAMCRRSNKAADIVLDVADLSAAYLGGVRFSTLAAAGRVEEYTSGAIVQADALFASDPLPYSGTPF